jgi:LmbE family N-acetylglucosaminyl deacetylase
MNRILMYESPTSRAFEPAMFVDVAGFADRKLELIRAHLSQVLKNGLVDLEAVEAQARYRGFQARMRQAEAFEVHRFVWDLSVDEASAPTMERHVVKLGEVR